MSVYKPPKSPFWHYDFQYQGRRYCGSTGAKTEGQACKVEQAKRILAAKGELDRKTVSVPTLGEAAAEWYLFRGFDDDILLTRVDAAVALVGPRRPVNEISAIDMTAAIRKRRERLVRDRTAPSNSTVNRDVVCVIRPILRRQAKLLKGAGVSFPDIDWAELTLPEPRPRARDFTAADMDGLVASLPHHWRDFARLQMVYGLRLGEMFFSPSDVNPEGCRLLVRERKNDDDLGLPLAKDDAAMLAARAGRAIAAGLDTVWFRELRTGKLKALTYNAAKQALRRAMRDCGLHARKKAKGSHDLRHHAGMQMLRTTKNLRTTQKLLGHRDIKSTLVYAHALDDDLRDGIEAVKSRNSPEPAKSAQEKTKPVRASRKRGTST